MRMLSDDEDQHEWQQFNVQKTEQQEIAPLLPPEIMINEHSKKKRKKKKKKVKEFQPKKSVFCCSSIFSDFGKNEVDISSSPEPPIKIVSTKKSHKKKKKRHKKHKSSKKEKE